MSGYNILKFKIINDNFIDSLINGTLYFASQDELNDPFDCNLNVIKSFKNAARSVTGERKEFLVEIIDEESHMHHYQAGLDMLGICSFSAIDVLTETLMWSHYADDHKGVCVQYEFSRNSFTDDKANFIVWANVDYNNNPLTEWLIEISGNIPTKQYFLHELLKLTITSKEKSWGYEKEYRMVRNGKGLLSIPKSSIKKIHFGLDTAKSDIDRITRITNSPDYSVDLYKAERGEDDFGIIFKKI